MEEEIQVDLKTTWEQVIARRYPESGAGQTKLEEDYCDEQSNPCQHGIINDFKLMMMMIGKGSTGLSLFHEIYKNKSAPVNCKRVLSKRLYGNICHTILYIPDRETVLPA